MKFHIKMLLIVLLVALISVLGIYAQTWLIMKGWNYFIADIFQVKEISIWGSLLLSIVIDIILGKFGPIKLTVSKKY